MKKETKKPAAKAETKSEGKYCTTCRLAEEVCTCPPDVRTLVSKAELENFIERNDPKTDE